MSLRNEKRPGDVVSQKTGAVIIATVFIAAIVLGLIMGH